MALGSAAHGAEMNMLMQQRIDLALRVLSGLLTPAIAAIAAYIAYQQWKTAHQQAETNKRQARLALFDKRMVVFNNTTKLIADVFREGQVTQKRLIIFVSETREHQFLFGPDIAQYLEELWRKGNDLAKRILVGQPEGQLELMQWFQDQLKEAPEKFAKYMRFPEP